MGSVEWSVMRAPARGYTAAVAAAVSSPMASLVGRVVVTAVVIGAAMTTAATDVLDVAVYRTALAWSFSVAVQVVAATILVLTTAHKPRVVSPARAIDLLFAANGPWFAWLAGYALWTQVTSPLGRPAHMALFSLLIPGIWTVLVVYRFCRVVLGVTPVEARWRTAAHQTGIWLIGCACFFWAVQGWPRVVGWLGWWKP